MIHKAGLVTKAQAFLTWEPLLFILRAMLFPIILPPTLLYLLNYEMTWCVFVLCRLPSWGVLEGTGVSPILLSSRSLAYLMSWGFWCSCAWSCEKVVLRKEAANITMARLLDVVQLLFSGGKKITLSSSVAVVLLYDLILEKYFMTIIWCNMVCRAWGFRDRWYIYAAEHRARRVNSKGPGGRKLSVRH